MTASGNSNDLPAPDGYVFAADIRAALAHLTAADEERALTLCGSAAGALEEFTYLPPALKVCSTCQRIADEASTR